MPAPDLGRGRAAAGGGRDRKPPPGRIAATLRHSGHTLERRRNHVKGAE